MELKCKLKDLCDDLMELGCTNIDIDEAGLGMAICDYLRCNGVNVNRTTEIEL